MKNTWEHQRHKQQAMRLHVYSAAMQHKGAYNKYTWQGNRAQCCRMALQYMKLVNTRTSARPIASIALLDYGDAKLHYSAHTKLIWQEQRHQ
jgi:hypothetical protein